MRYCLLCDMLCQQVENLVDLFCLPSNVRAYLCSTCEQKMVLLRSQERCRQCLGQVLEHELECQQCSNWEASYKLNLRHRAIYEYNGFAKDILWRIKHNRDIMLAKILITILEKCIFASYDMSKTLFIPYPSSSDSIETRRFSLTSYILENCRLHLDICSYFLTITEKNEKQHKKNKVARLSYANEQLKYDVNQTELLISGEKEIVIFDDVLTSGASMVAAYRSLYKAGIQNVSSLSIFR